MTTGQQITSDLAGEGVTLWLDGQQLRFRSVKPLTAAQADRLKRNKPAIIQWLESPECRLSQLLDSHVGADPEARQVVVDQFEELAAVYQLSNHIARWQAELEAVDTVGWMLREAA